MEIVPRGPGFAAELRGIALAEVTVRPQGAYAAVRAATEADGLAGIRPL